jgi:hypothetical protein
MPGHAAVRDRLGDDRLVSTTDSRYLGAIGYDTHGNTVALGGHAFVFDGADRHVQTSLSGTTLRYGRDATDRIIERKVNGTVGGPWES